MPFEDAIHKLQVNLREYILHNYVVAVVADVWCVLCVVVAVSHFERGFKSFQKEVGESVGGLVAGRE